MHGESTDNLALKFVKSPHFELTVMRFECPAYFVLGPYPIKIGIGPYP